MQNLAISVLAPPPVAVLQQQMLLPVVQPSASSKGSGSEPSSVQLVFQAPSSCSGSSGIPASNTAQVSV